MIQTLYATFMTVSKLLTIFLLTFSLSACSKMDNSKNLTALKDLSEKTGIEMIVIDEAEKITQTKATRFLRRLIGSSYIDDPIQSPIRQDFPRTKTVELPGISFLVDNSKIKLLVDILNKKFAYRKCIAFISDDDSRDDKKQTISIIHSADKYNTLRLQETSGGSYIFSTDSLITKLKRFEEKYPFDFVGAGDDWLLIKVKDKPTDWTDFAKEVLKVCPNEETTFQAFADAHKKDGGLVSMWWD